MKTLRRWVRQWWHVQRLGTTGVWGRGCALCLLELYPDGLIAMCSRGTCARCDLTRRLHGGPSA